MQQIIIYIYIYLNIAACYIMDLLPCSVGNNHLLMYKINKYIKTWKHINNILGNYVCLNLEVVIDIKQWYG